ncbi:MAG: septum formation protein Maf [Clostridia bacterium]|nr:septum formation protein Maf [Clostridia bacterium]
MSEYRFPEIIPVDARLLLASASPRRRELLASMGLSFEISVCEVDEQVDSAVHPADATVLLAARKARAAYARFGREGDILLASDTLVECDGIPLGKPVDGADAVRTLMMLSGRAHNVHTGVAVIYRGRLFAARDTTAVRMRAFTEEEARGYVATGEPMDKAGAYGIQGLGGRLVEGFDGEYDTVVGLPTHLTDLLLCRAVEHPEEGEPL